MTADRSAGVTEAIEYTPTTAEVRRAFASWFVGSIEYTAQGCVEFDRWLESERAAARAQVAGELIEWSGMVGTGLDRRTLEVAADVVLGKLSGCAARGGGQ